MRIVNCGMFQFVCRYCVCFQIVTKMAKKQKFAEWLCVCVCVCVSVCVCVFLLSRCDVLDICCCLGFDKWVGCMWVD